MLIGLPQAEAVELEIHWPSGHVQNLTELSVDRYWRIYPDREPEPWPANGW
jgi:hypothetical protein